MISEPKRWAFYIHQLAVKYTCPFHYISWNNAVTEWRCNSISVWRMWPYYLMLLINLLYAFAYCIALATSKQWRTTSHVSSVHLYTSGLYVLCIVFIFAGDYFFLSARAEFVYCANYLTLKKNLNVGSHFPRVVTNSYINAENTKTFSRKLLETIGIGKPLKYKFLLFDSRQ